MYVYNAAMFSLAIVLTVLGGGVTWLAWQRRGLSSTLFWLAMTLVPSALYLTGLLRIVSVMIDQITSFVTGFVFSPSVWAGLIVAMVAAVCFGASRATKDKALPEGRTRGRKAVGPDAPAAGNAQPRPKEVRAPRSQGKPVIDDDMDEIEKILRDHGIS